MFVNANRQKDTTPSTIMGTAIFTDLDNTTYTIKPAKKQPIAVLVPDWNIPHRTNNPVIIKKIWSFLNFEVKPINKKATEVEAALQP